MRFMFCATLMVCGLAAFAPPSMGDPWEPGTTVFEYRESSEGGPDRSLDSTIIGSPATHVAKFKDTLLDIARLNHLGYQELKRVNPGVDTWLPGDGTRVTIPAQWILPEAPREGLVLNIPEMRLYYYLPDSRVMTFPLGVGREGQETPAGGYRIGEKRTNPVWYVPVAIQAEMEHPRKTVPPGPNNPLGKYWMRLSHTTYGIHGTNNPWAIGRRVTHGCIRLYPEDIRLPVSPGAERHARAGPTISTPRSASGMGKPTFRSTAMAKRVTASSWRPSFDRSENSTSTPICERSESCCWSCLTEP